MRAIFLVFCVFRGQVDENAVNRKDIAERVGNIAQIAGAQKYTIQDGNGNGVGVVSVRTGSGLGFDVLSGRGMDIGQCFYKDIPIAWMSPAGITSPAYYEEMEDRWLRSFSGGLLTTCGMTYCGASCTDVDWQNNMEKLGVHGRVSNYTAEDVAVEQEWVSGEYNISIRGKVRQAALYKENFVLTRRISTALGGNTITISDSIENLGFTQQPLMVLYHINFGYPIVSENSRLVAAIKETIARPGQDEAAREMNLFAEFTAPQEGYAERCYYHALKGDGDGSTYAMLVNDELNLGIYVKYNIKQLFNLVEWKQMQTGIYAVGIEPANCYLEGRNKSREGKTLQFIQPGEIKKFDIEIGILDGKQEIQRMEEIIKSL